jgi:hypothetical protein
MVRGEIKIKLELFTNDSSYKGVYFLTFLKIAAVYPNTLVALLMLIAVGNSALAMVHKTFTLYTLKLSWDSERPASNDITLGKRKKSAGAILGRWGSS